MSNKTNKTENTMNILAVMLVLFTAMLDPRVSIVLATILIIVYIVHYFFRNPLK